MCGAFARITVSNDIELPHFPEEIDRDDMSWQSKQGLNKYAGPYRITAEGRLEQKKVSNRDKTDEEKQAEAKKWGFNSWEDYVQAYDDWHEQEKDNENGVGTLIPPEVDWDKNDDKQDDVPPTITPSEQITDEKWWADISHHGTFEFHQLLQRDPTEYKEIEKGTTGETIERPSEYALNVFLEYEARFDKGDLTDIVFMGSRGISSSGGDPIGHALDKIEEWREWKEAQE